MIKLNSNKLRIGTWKWKLKIQFGLKMKGRKVFLNGELNPWPSAPHINLEVSDSSRFVFLIFQHPSTVAEYEDGCTGTLWLPFWGLEQTRPLPVLHIHLTAWITAPRYRYPLKMTEPFFTSTFSNCFGWESSPPSTLQHNIVVVRSNKLPGPRLRWICWIQSVSFSEWPQLENLGSMTGTDCIFFVRFWLLFISMGCFGFDGLCTM